MIKKIAFFTFRHKAFTKLAQYYFVGLLLLFLTHSIFFYMEISRDLKDYHNKKNNFQMIATLEKTYAVKPPSLTSFISTSDKSLLPNWIMIKPYEIVDLGGNSEPTSLLSNVTTLDWRIIIGIWCSLITMLFACDSLADRKTSRLLRMLWSFPITRGQYFWGKLIGQLAVTYIPLIFIIILSLIIDIGYMLFIGFSVDFLDLFLKVALVLIATLPYLTIFTLIGWLTSIIWQSESSAILGSITIWTLLVWMWPALGMITGQLTSNLDKFQTASQMWTKIETDALGTISTSSLRSILNQNISELEKKKRILQLEENLEAKIEENIRKARDKSLSLKRDYRFSREQQTQHAILLTKLSPYGQWKQLMDEIATSGYGGYLYFLSLTDNYSKSFGKFSDELKSSKRYNAEYKSIGTVGYAGYTCNIRSGKVFDHIPLPKSAPDFIWKKKNTSELISNFILSVSYFLTVLICLLLIVMTSISKINLV